MGNRKRKRRNTKTYNRALHVAARMRRTGMSLSAASREEHMDPRTVRKYLGADLRRGIRGTQIIRGDRRRRDMVIPTASGNAPVAIHGSKQASRLGRYMSAVGKYLRTGNSDDLNEFEGQSIAGHLLITDPDLLSSLGQAGALQMDQIYAVPEASS